jgi:Uma2 family endonuclease
MSPPTLAIGEHVSHAQTEQRVIIRFVSWTTYEHLLADLSNQSPTRLTYDRGMLEIMRPLPEHEEWNRTIALLVEMLAEEMRIDVRNFGSTTFRRADLARGFEPDSCFYIQHEADISGKSTIDLTVDPPPDLVIEVDVTSGSLDKFPIYAQVGVPEVWRYDGQRLRISILTVERYVESETSLALPLLTGPRLSDTLAQSKTMGRTALLRSFRTWVRQERRRQRR